MASFGVGEGGRQWFVDVACFGFGVGLVVFFARWSALVMAPSSVEESQAHQVSDDFDEDKLRLARARQARADADEFDKHIVHLRKSSTPPKTILFVSAEERFSALSLTSKVDESDSQRKS